jgi:hypothetical protein
MGFVRRNTYYTGIVYEWNLPTGWTCPQAHECLVRVDMKTGKADNLSNAYRCYAASAERYPTARLSRWRNLMDARKLEIPPLPEQAHAVRIHASGDFFSQRYFDAWLAFIRQYPATDFWAFTKSVQFWANRLGDLPPNLVMTASLGGKQDHLVPHYDLRYAQVVASQEEADELGLQIDTNDDLARKRGPSFALLDKRSSE